ncbi:hypothetical protein FXO38_32141 [Capsicum annuum]|nr:hypothetical protein FXO38_32141 [Capsicum annuum]
MMKDGLVLVAIAKLTSFTFLRIFKEQTFPSHTTGIVYPKEAVAAAFGEKLDDIFRLPSNDIENGLPNIPCPNEVSSKHLGEEILRLNMIWKIESPIWYYRGIILVERGLCPLNGFHNITHLESDSELGELTHTQFGDLGCKTSTAYQEFQKTEGSSLTKEKLKFGGMSTSEYRSSGKIKEYGEVTTKRLYESFKENNYPDVMQMRSSRKVVLG